MGGINAAEDSCASPGLASRSRRPGRDSAAVAELRGLGSGAFDGGRGGRFARAEGAGSRERLGQLEA